MPVDSIGGRPRGAGSPRRPSDPATATAQAKLECAHPETAAACRHPTAEDRPTADCRAADGRARAARSGAHGFGGPVPAPPARARSSGSGTRAPKPERTAVRRSGDRLAGSAPLMPNGAAISSWLIPSSSRITSATRWFSGSARSRAVSAATSARSSASAAAERPPPTRSSTSSAAAAGGRAGRSAPYCGRSGRARAAARSRRRRGAAPPAPCGRSPG